MSSYINSGERKETDPSFLTWNIGRKTSIDALAIRDKIQSRMSFELVARPTS